LSQVVDAGLIGFKLVLTLVAYRVVDSLKVDQSHNELVVFQLQIKAVTSEFLFADDFYQQQQ
jgi:hypothetical protein